MSATTAWPLGKTSLRHKTKPMDGFLNRSTRRCLKMLVWFPWWVQKSGRETTTYSQLATKNVSPIGTAKTAYDWSNTVTWTVSYTALQIDWLITLDNPYTRLRANYKTAKLMNHIDSNEDDYWPACQLNISHQRRFFNNYPRPRTIT